MKKKWLKNIIAYFCDDPLTFTQLPSKAAGYQCNALQRELVTLTHTHTHTLPHIHTYTHLVVLN